MIGEFSADTTVQSEIIPAVKRYEAAQSNGTRQDILDTLTPDSPQRQSYAGIDEDFNLSREAINAANYPVEATNLRDVEVSDGAASLFADLKTTRNDDGTPATIMADELRYDLRLVDGQWLVHDVGGNVVRPTPHDGRRRPQWTGKLRGWV